MNFKKFIYESENNFQKWFKGSVMVNSDGSPKVFYHGSNKKIQKFKTGIKTVRTMMFLEIEVESQGIFLSESKEDAKSYGSNVYPLYVKVNNPLLKADYMEITSKNPQIRWFEDIEYIFSPLISDNHIEVLAKKPIHIDEDGEWVYEVGSTMFWHWFDNPEVVKRIKERGYDGVWSVWEPNDESGESLLAFSGDQLKSADNNDGTFDIEDDNIFS